MAKKNSPSNTYEFTPVVLDQDSHEKRRIIEQLPVVHQTETLQKFFGASADHLFDTGKGKSINGYVGQKPLWYDPDQDYYLEESTPDRGFYQLEASMVSRSVEGNLTDLLPYPDLINQLRFQGALVDNHDRLFSQNFYCWCPPIDLDKIINFRQYVWLRGGATEVVGPRVLRGPTTTTVSAGTTAAYQLPGYEIGGDVKTKVFYDLGILTHDLMTVTVDGVSRDFSYVGGDDKITFLQIPPLDSVVEISVYSDVENTAMGLATADPRAFGGLSLSSGMRISIQNDLTTDYQSSDIWIVENVGTSIRLLRELPRVFSTSDYLVMGRGSQNANEWSSANRWFHVSTLPSDSDADYVLANRATRPIVEFDADLELYHYGKSRRLDVDLMVTDIEDFGGYLNLNSTLVNLDGVQVALGQGSNIHVQAVNPLTGLPYGDLPSIRILVRGTTNDLLNDRVFVLVNQNGALKLILETDGADPSGQPVTGEVLRVLLGSSSLVNFYWNGVSWAQSQTKTHANQPPLFELYDLQGNNLADPGVYPGSTFQGNALFSYQVDTTGTKAADPVIGLPLVHDNKGQILFENYLGTQRARYLVDGDLEEISGFYFHKIGNLDSELEIIRDDWYKVDQPSKQYMIDRYVATGRSRTFAISQDTNNIQVTIGRVNDSQSFEKVLLKEDQDFIRSGRKILVFKVLSGDIVEIRTYQTGVPPLDSTGYFEVPLNLQANADNDEVSSLTKGDFYDHFSEIMSNQIGFTGAQYSDNNYRDTSKARNLGTHIIQNSSGLLKTMLLAGQSSLDIMNAIRFADSEYARFKDKFQNKILDYSLKGKLTNATSYDVWINMALLDINQGKTKHFPFYLSAMAKNDANQLPTFIPPTPTFLGVAPLYQPSLIEQDVATSSGPATVWYIRGHDGSLTLGQNEICAQVILALENRIFDSIAAPIRGRERPITDWQTSYGDQFRINSYTYDEYLQILGPSFERWTIDYRLDSETNDTYDYLDPWTWNWSSLTTAQGNRAPGHWRGIYEKFFGTQRPDLTPWESLGFTIKPSWWDDRYGSAPYTSDNLVLWKDLENGFIFKGPRQGINAPWARPGLTAHIPVDLKGRLRHPGPRNLVALDVPGDALLFLGDDQDDLAYVEWEDTHDEGVLGCGILDSVPLPQERSSKWIWGDVSPVEQQWRRSSSFVFATAQAGYLMNPSRFVELGWNTKDLDLYFKGTANEQFLSQDTRGRPRHTELQVHGEVLEDLTMVTKIGIQQWISDFLVSTNTSVNTGLALKVRGLGTQLSYKVGGFTDSSTLVVVSDAFGRVPSEDVTVSLYRSPSVREEVYSGVAIQLTSHGYEIFGYDTLDPRFSIIPPSMSGNQISVGTGAATAALPVWSPNTYYSVNLTLRYQGNFYRCLKTHTSASSFEDEFWTQVARPQYANGATLTWYLESEVDVEVQTVPYGTVFKTPQEVANFINSYERYLVSRGWQFTEIVSGDQDVRDWRQALVSFILWSDNDQRTTGDYLMLSPSSSLVRFSTDQGAIQPVEQIVNGLYAIVDQNGQPIDTQVTRVVRDDGSITIACDDKTTGVFGLRLYISEIEHVLVFDNQTIFGDTIYNPLLNIHQPRLRLQGFKTVDWKGRIDAPGFIVTGNTLTPNFERAADDFRRFFDAEAMENKTLQDRARANFGYEEREYLNNLLLTPTNQFEFYQGMIQQKGSPTSMRRLLRSNFIRHNKGLKIFEEWAFRVGDYGGQEVSPSLDIQVKQSEFKHNPQLITFNQAPLGTVVPNTFGVVSITDFIQDGILEELDARWHWRPNMREISWPLSDSTDQILPTPGYVNLDEVRFTLASFDDFENFYGQQVGTSNAIATNDRVWVYGIGEETNQGKKNLDAWMTYKFNDTGIGVTNIQASVIGDQGPIAQLNGPVRGFQDINSDSSGFYINQLNDDRLVFMNLQGSDLFSSATYTPRFSNTLSTNILGNGFTSSLIMGLAPGPQMIINGIKVTVSEAFASGSTLELGTEITPDLFLGLAINGALASVDLTSPGVQEFKAQTGFTQYPFDTNLALPGQSMIAQVISTGITGNITIEVQYMYGRGFEILTTQSGSLDTATANQSGGTAQLFSWTKTRYPTLSQVPQDSRLWSDGDIIEIDSSDYDPGRWSVYRRTQGTWVEIRHQNRKVNSELLTSAALFDDDHSKLKLILQLYDPCKGFIPGIADRELDYKTLEDPAIYGDGRLVWSKEQVGRLWWDLSTVRYLDYEINDDLQGGITYRWKNWGRIAPNSTVDIMEWTRSPVQPSSWNDFVASKANLKIDFKPSGIIDDYSTTQFVTREEWNDDIQADEIVYYFWTKNSTVVPEALDRNLSAQQVSNIITNPMANDVPFFAVIDTNKVIIGGIKQFLTEDDTVLKIKWTKEAEIHNNHHKQWIILREDDERNVIPDSLWNKMRDSLVGWDKFTNQQGILDPKSVPDIRLPAAQQIGSLIRPRQSWFPVQASPLGSPRPNRSAREAFVDTMNSIMSEQPFIDQWYDWQSVFNSGEAQPSSDQYVTTALDLSDLQDLLPESRNMVQVGEKVLVPSTAEARGFWTLWRLDDVAGQRTFVLDDFQKWRIQEGELWNLADWYASDWSADNFPNYRFANPAARDAAGNLDYTLLKGTLVQLDQQSAADPRWSWDVYTNSTKYQVAKGASTISLSSAFYDDARVEFGPKEIKTLLASSITPSRISELGDKVANRDGSAEIQFLIDSILSNLFTTIQRNTLFFSMVKSSFKQTKSVDWAFKTSFLYLGGYSEILRQSPVAFKDQIDNVIDYLEEVKPYHVKIREYVRRLSYGPDLANLSMSDFDKPVYPEGSTNRVLDPLNSVDQGIMMLNSPWKDWYTNRDNANTNLASWDQNWNPIRRSKIGIKFDRVSCGELSGWNTSPWDPDLMVFSQKAQRSSSLSSLSKLYRNSATDGNANFYRDQAVESIDERNLLVRQGIVTPSRPGTIVVVLADLTTYMWSGSNWIAFESVGWERDPDQGSVTRINESYHPLPGMTTADDPSLIAGCDFGGTVITSVFQSDEWDLFEWDSTGYGGGLQELTGQDLDTLDGNVTAQDESSPDYIAVTGNAFSQPGVNGARPHELVQIRGNESVLINVTKTTGDFQKSLMNSVGSWEILPITGNNATFVSWDQVAKTMALTVPSWTEDSNGFTPLHDPQNPSSGFVKSVTVSKGYRSNSTVDMTSMGVKTFKIRDAVSSTFIPAGLMGNNVRVVVINPKDPTKRAVGVVNNTRGSEANWNGTITVTFTDGFVYLGTGSRWNIIPVDNFNSPGVVWVGNARFTYSSMTRLGNNITLKGVYLSGNTLDPLVITGTTATLRDTSPVYDGSIHRRKV